MQEAGQLCYFGLAAVPKHLGKVLGPRHIQLLEVTGVYSYSAEHHCCQEHCGVVVRELDLCPNPLQRNVWNGRWGREGGEDL